jgi:hypothetical protein
VYKIRNTKDCPPEARREAKGDYFMALRKN